MDTWRNVSHVSKFKIYIYKDKKKKGKSKGKGKEETDSVRERREKKSFREINSSLSLRFTKIGP